ncbi:right-handed parallel beta-helix repeat-containing protein [Microbulbifer sp. MLAF003]|uniref:right-handed parallel beta-helix repeat-containing protein n=1 Tax=Microbulbifer sp. MLAF003 TaxID=3032582 RepID=UPI0024ACC3A3|nr:right-handed parallel beta-helix repeat-containing protein [Microbulbifer sp. MLAF003]WHI52727.1 right-handed parallel beta-helix repeat-containing protein [Microbulbifer sp. MLAF003]
MILKVPAFSLWPIALGTLSIGISSQSLAVSCYDVIKTPAILTENLQCELSDANPYALTIAGPGGNLRMIGDGGITCTGSVTNEKFGIFIKGSSHSVTGGTISNCPGGILVGGLGFHSILYVEILDYLVDDAIQVDSNFNLIQGNTILGNKVDGDDGIDSNGDNNFIIQNTVIDSGGEGIIVEGNSVTVTLNEVVGSASAGIDFEGLNGTITYNTLLENDLHGIEVDTSGAFVFQNTSSHNMVAGIEIEGSNNVVRGNTSNNNGTVGILVSDQLPESSNNTIRKNVALGNPIDLEDPFADSFCDNLINDWGNNTADSSTPACLRFLP